MQKNESIASMSSIIIKKDFIVKTSKFNTEIICGKDYEFYAKVAIYSKFCLVNFLLAFTEKESSDKLQPLVYAAIINVID